MADAHAPSNNETKPDVPVRGSDSSWEQLIAVPLSDDPTVNAIGELPLSEIETILANEDHPDHAAVVEFNRLLHRRLQPTINLIFRAKQVVDVPASAMEPRKSRRAELMESMLPPTA